ncbi:MAG: META domain-containing protein [Pseudomonadota bacterium]|nr:META domain-containing protein [Pseudomonadota bacterium]
MPEAITPDVGWKVQYYRSGDDLVTPLDGANITAIFGSDGRLSGSTGCNNYFSTYGATNQSIHIDKIAQTKMACSNKNGIMKQEATYVENLSSAAKITMVDNALTLKNSDNETLIIFILALNIRKTECSNFGWGLACTYNHNGVAREYILYVPQSYDGDKDVPLLFNFHGYSSNAEGHHRGRADFRDLAEKENFILVVPQGSLFEGVTHWNVGANKTRQSTADDIGFTNALIEKITSEYRVDSERIYSTGMSNGGYMSYHLACLLSEKIAAIASVTGSMTPTTFDSCSPIHPTSILQIHGTADSSVPYEGANWTLPIDEVLKYWSTYNDCDSLPTISSLSDQNSDGLASNVISHSNCRRQVSVQLYKMKGMGHQWPEIEIGSDISATQVIWGFLSKYNLNGLIKPTRINLGS